MSDHLLDTLMSWALNPARTIRDIERQQLEQEAIQHRVNANIQSIAEKVVEHLAREVEKHDMDVYGKTQFAESVKNWICLGMAEALELIKQPRDWAEILKEDKDTER